MSGNEWNMVIVVAVMFGLMVFASSLLHRYQTHKAELRAKVRKFEQGINFIEDALDKLQQFPLPEELAQLMRQDLIDRYEGLKEVFPQYPEIDRKLREAKLKLNNENKLQVEEMPEPETETELGEYTAGIDEILHYMDSIRPYRQPMSVDAVTIFKLRLGENRAELISKYLIGSASRAESAGNRQEAIVYLSRLMGILRQRGPNTDFVRELYEDVGKHLQELQQPKDPEVADEDEETAKS